MTKTRRIIHHACWFALLGPHLGVPVTIVGQMLTCSDASTLLLRILLLLPIFMLYTWIAGGIAALLTGIATACLPEPIYHNPRLRVLACGATGAVIASLYWLAIPGATVANFLWISTGPGLLAGLIMGWLVPYLPFRGEKTQPQPEMNGELR
ncbi:MAG: hypothetical protein RSE29_03900 [Leclercia sp.]